METELIKFALLIISAVVIAILISPKKKDASSPNHLEALANLKNQSAKERKKACKKKDRQIADLNRCLSDNGKRKTRSGSDRRAK